MSQSTEANEVVWERWTRKRTFVRALEGTYGELVQELFSQPRIYSTQSLQWKGGPQNYGKKVINPQAVRVAQSIESHVDVFAPGGHGQKHGHMNSAVFFVLKGKGHDVHDGRRIDWEAGDVHVVWSTEDMLQVREMAREAWGVWRDKSPMAKKLYESQVSFMKQIGLLE